MSKYVVTGGAGFIGNTLVEELVGHGHEVHSIDRDPTFRRGIVPREAILHELDVRDTAAVKDICEGADVVFHMAAHASVPFSIDHPLESSNNNLLGTISVLEAAVQAKVRRVVYSASASAYGNQTTLPLVENMAIDLVNPYGLQKYAGELFMALWPRVYGIETVSLRYFNVYGPNMDPNGPYALAVGRFLKARKEGTPITIYGDGTVTRDFVHVSDVVRANMLAATSGRVGKGEVINIGTGRNVSIRALADLFGGRIVYAPPRVEAHDSLADIQKAKELLEWEPIIALEEGIAALKEHEDIM